MIFDVFFSICQTEVEGTLPSEKTMFENFFDQVRLADGLGYSTAWVAETHLSCEIQKQLPSAVIPNFKGEIGLNTDILQLAHKIFSQTKKIHVGSAIRNILCNGGPIAHAEAVRTFLTLHGLSQGDSRLLQLGFASGRFEFSNRPYGIRPRSEIESMAWPVVKGKLLAQATEIFLRLLRGDQISSENIWPMLLKPEDFRSNEDWEKLAEVSGAKESIELAPFWEFEKLGVIPFDSPMELLRLTIGTHDPYTQILANQFLPVGVFNLSITPPQIIEETHERMRAHYHKGGGPWQRSYMPRTAMVFLNHPKRSAKEQASKAWENYWLAMEGTLDQKKVDQAVGNALLGSPQEVIEEIKKRYHPEDRLMLWFDFNNHDNDMVKYSMREFAEKIAPEFS